jgi:hypothetical protein
MPNDKVSIAFLLAGIGLRLTGHLAPPRLLQSSIALACPTGL